ARLESRTPPAAVAAVRGKTAAVGLAGTLARLQSSLDRVEDRQVATLNSLEQGYDSKARRISSVLAELGVKTQKVAVPPAPAVGGPFVPVKPGSDTAAFERQLYRINLARAQVDQLNRTLVTVPVRKPVPGEIDMSSPFGVRMDPFLGRPTMHTGIDFRGDMGEAIPATAAGKVTSAGWSGGYGNMVEVDHGNGF